MTTQLFTSLDQVPWTIWEKLATSTHQLFLTKAYVEAWVQHIMPEEHPGARLHILSIETDGVIVGFLPFLKVTKDSLTTYKLIGTTEVTDYVDFLVLPAHYHLVTETLIQLITNQTISLDFHCLLPDAAARKIVQKMIADFDVREVEETVNPSISLPATWEEYLSLLPQTYQKNYRRLLSSIGEEDEITYRCLFESNEVAHAIDDFIMLHKASGSEKAAFWTPARENFFRDMTVNMAKTNKVKLYFLDVNDDPAATLLVFDHNHEFQLYNSGFNAYRYGYLGVGNALILYTIREAIKQNKGGYNFLRGDEAYKFSFGAVPSPVYALTVTPK